MLASDTPAGIPFIVSTWGNDLTLHAPASARMSALTRKTLRRADALISDTRRDARLVQAWGFNRPKPVLVGPGNGGLDLAEMRKSVTGIVRADPPQIIDPRGLRSYIRTDISFRPSRWCWRNNPNVRFVCTSMQGQKEALDCVEKLGIARNVTLLPLPVSRNSYGRNSPVRRSRCRSVLMMARPIPCSKRWRWAVAGLRRHRIYL